ncbi:MULTISPECIES: DoxX family protein [Pseudomonas]|uniref:Membrane protein n=2 Tax=Pseudomonadaceae TaxID=135621 RepID=A0A0D0J2F1_9PSED|nr:MULTISPECIES: DoxX family protein [Pseudomonas]KIP99703.1 membrane protein [Pseudomonas fulva]MCW2291718.1 small-conductance mechanosensitive channel [Pseudomonas sp. BIGb0408]NYH73711.1 small-conductance mechanosensitive channel [Pseudomonas flavescens]
MIESYLYWFSTALLSLLYLASATLYIVKRDWVRQALADLGYPAYLVPLLTAVKLLAVATMLSRFSVVLSDLAYAGMFFHLLLSGLAHIGVRKPGGALPALIGLLLLGASFVTQNAARELASPYGPMVVAQQTSPN